MASENTVQRILEQRGAMEAPAIAPYVGLAPESPCNCQASGLTRHTCQRTGRDICDCCPND